MRYPRTYLDWCIDGDNSISDYAMSKAIDAMEHEQALQDQQTREYIMENIEAPSYNFEEVEPVPYHEVCTNRITELLEC